MELRDAKRKWKPWKRWKRPVLGSSTEKASPLKPTLSTTPTLTEPAGQTAESPSTGKRDRNIQVRDLWAEALKTLSKEDQAAFQAHSNPDLGILQHLCAIAEQKRDDCEKRGWKFNLNGRQIILRDLAQKIIVWIDKFKEVGNVVANFDPVHVALPWAGVRFLLQVRVESVALTEMKLILKKMTVAESQQMGALLIGVEKVTYLINRCKIYEILYLRDKRSGQALADLEPAETNPEPAMENPESAVVNLEPAVANLESALVTLYAAMLRFLSTANQLYDKSVAARAIHSILNPDKVVSFVDECRSLEKRVDIEASNCERTYSRAKLGECGERLKQLLAGLQEPIVRVDSRVAALHDRLDESERSEILTWVSDIQYESNHYTARKGRTDGTGEWLLRHERYREWRGSSASTILWLHGIPGAGKTKLASSVVDDLLGSFGQYPNDEALAYFYCDRNESARRDPELILSSFARQLSLSRNGDAIQHSLVQLYYQKRKTGFASGKLKIEESRDILLQLVRTYPQTTLVLDALDECHKETRTQLVDILDTLVTQSPKPVKIFISSRPDQDIKHRFGCGPNVHIKATDNRDDIAKFVNDKLNNSPEYWQNSINRDLKKEICETLVDKSEGMFQWVYLQIKQLLELLPLECDIRERLGKLPDSLDKAYDEIYAKIRARKGIAPEIANRAFQWVMCSCTPLSSAKLVAAVRQDPETDAITSVDINMSIVLDACHNLLVVDQQLGVCRFSHLSVQEYFENHHWNRSQANGLVAKVCLSLLNDPIQQNLDPGLHMNKTETAVLGTLCSMQDFTGQPTSKGTAKKESMIA